MKPLDQAVFDELFAKYDLEKLRQMAAASAMTAAVGSAAIDWWNRLDSDPLLAQAQLERHFNRFSLPGGLSPWNLTASVIKINALKLGS